MTGGQDTKYQSPQPVASINPPLAILADDLTGACDAAVAFTRAFDSVRVQIDPGPYEGACVQALVTESRDLTAAEAQARVQSVAERLPSNSELFKKIDSVFRGNTIAEIAIALRDFRYDIAVLAPAYPALGRAVRNGVLYIHEALSDRTLPVAKVLADAGCSFTALAADLSPDELSATLRRCLGDPARAVLCDTVRQDDLERIARAARSLGKRVLWIGSGGLAHAVASGLPPVEPKPEAHPRLGHAIFFVGTPHTATRAQIDHLRRTKHIALHRSDSMQATASDLVFPIVLGETSADNIREVVAAYDPEEVGCLFMTGGDTAHFVCRALGITALHLKREFAPGVPLATVEGGSFDGVPVILKSGGFGEPDLLSRLLETCHPEVIA